MQEDNKGFLYPIVNESECINCGLCERFCHEQHPYDERRPQKAYAVINRDEDIRMRSSSGGIFYLLAERTISEGGVVFGARFDEHWQVVIDYAETMEDVRAFMGSKYVQARMETALLDSKRFLREGRKVLFSGTPCQIASLHHFLGKSYDNLLTVDVVCHGVPSPKVWNLYLDEVMDAGRKAINDVQFRNKRNGWNRFKFTMTYNKEEQTVSLCSFHRENHYMRAFLSDMILRPSCHNCQAKNGRSHSDITIADFWGINIEMPEMDDDKGTGLVLVNTDKGYAAFDWNKIIHKETEVTIVLRYNPAYHSSAIAHLKHEDFFVRIDKSDSLTNLINDCLYPTLRNRLRKKFFDCKCQIKRCLRFVMGGKYGNDELSSIPFMSDNISVISITFRNKQQGWKSYRMEIKIGV